MSLREFRVNESLLRRSQSLLLSLPRIVVQFQVYQFRNIAVVRTWTFQKQLGCLLTVFYFHRLQNTILFELLRSRRRQSSHSYLLLV
jgi:hypothetical protein